MARRAGHGRLAAAVATTVAITAAEPAFAQNTAHLPLQFDFLPPGARSVLEINGAADLASKTKYVTFSVVIRY